MNTITRLTLVACLFLAVGATALLLQSWVNGPARGSVIPVEEAIPRLRELARRERIALAALAGAAIAAVAFAAVLPTSRPRAEPEISPRQDVELLARAAATQSEALAHERDVRQRTEENLAMEQMRAGQAVADKVRLGRDLHDGLVQSLDATGLTLATARQKISAEPARAAELLDRGVELLNATIREMRAAIGGLSAARQQEQSFSAAVRTVTEMLGSGRDATFATYFDAAAAARVGETQLPDLLQMIREAVSNALRHGAAKTVTLRLHEDAGQLALLVQDDGRGFDPEKVSPAGHGLANLRARAALLRGELRVTSAPGVGTRVVLTFPAAEPAVPV
jgi:signal transduction histidine kinase